jgi:hypothetical protein
MRSPAVLDEKGIDRAERTASLRDWVRRITWHLLAMSGKEMIRKCRKDRDFALSLARIDQHLGPYVDNLQSIIGFVEGMHGQIMICLACREDMSEIIAEAKKPGEGPDITIDNVHELLRQHDGKREETKPGIR